MSCSVTGNAYLQINADTTEFIFLGSWNALKNSHPLLAFQTTTLAWGFNDHLLLQYNPSNVVEIYLSHTNTDADILIYDFVNFTGQL